MRGYEYINNELNELNELSAHVTSRLLNPLNLLNPL